MSVSEELDILHTAAGIFPLSGSRNSAFARAFLRITGPDATRWLNGMVTNNIKDLQPGEGNYNFLLNAQGRIMGDCMIYREPSELESVFTLETDATQIDALEALLNKFIIMDDVELAQRFYISFPIEATIGLLIVGLQAGELLIKAVSDPWEKPFTTPPAPSTITRANAHGGNLTILASTNQSVPTFELWFPDAQEAGLISEYLTSLGARELSTEAQEAYRILSGTPRYGTDIRNSDTAKDLPQETSQTHALHFSKGCYLGQEIVERIHSRGQVHRTFTRFTLTPDAGEPTVPTLPAQLTSNGKSAGDITSAVLIGDKIHALGYIRRELLETHAPITYPGGIATPSATK